MLGGTTTNGGVNFPGLFHAWGRQVIAGIGWELVAQTVAETGDSLPDFTHYQQKHWKLQVRVNRFVYAALADEKLSEAGASVLFHAMLAKLKAKPDASGWLVTLCTKEGLHEVDTKVVIDCTGDANAVALAGLKLRQSPELQPATLSCQASGYDMEALDIEAINQAFEREVAAGRLAYTDVSWNSTKADAAHWLHNHGANANHVHDIDARTSQGKSELELASRGQLLRLYRFLKQQPGLEHLVIEQVSPECGVRETVTIEGQAMVTVHDYQSGRVWEDALCYAFYPIDLHKATGKGLQCEPLKEGVVPTVPRGALLPKDSQRLIVAGRCLSSDQLANSALRIQATCMATGQAAGAMAALSARDNTDPARLPMSAIRAMLKEHGAIVPGDDAG